MFGLLFSLLPEFGPLNQMLMSIFRGKPLFFLSGARYFRSVVVISDI